jgi:ligand-binding SRPBCC domain-containing protein
MIEFTDGPEHYTLHARQRLLAPLATVFPFFADARNLEALTPPFLRFTIRTEGEIPMQAGALIDYRIMLRGIPIPWRTRIAVWEPPQRFVDEQLRGPYRLWYHEHTFVDHGDETEVIDKVDYKVLFGSLVEPWLVRPDLRKIFAYRRAELTKRFGSRD